MLPELFRNNRTWAKAVEAQKPGFFHTLARQQAPEYLWIGCSDSRVPANEIVGLLPGQLFVHRNVGNLVVHSDMNCLSVLQYAVDVLKVRHIIVCGHYGCGGVRAAVERRSHGLVDNWLRHIRDTQREHATELSRGHHDRNWVVNRLCELNVFHQVCNVCSTTVVHEAWRRRQPLDVHGWIYGIEDGLLRDIGVRASGTGDLASLERTPHSPRRRR